MWDKYLFILHNIQAIITWIFFYEIETSSTYNSNYNKWYKIQQNSLLFSVR